jgi:hypothetical protein
MHKCRERCYCILPGVGVSVVAGVLQQNVVPAMDVSAGVRCQEEASGTTEHEIVVPV